MFVLVMVVEKLKLAWGGGFLTFPARWFLRGRGGGNSAWMEIGCFKTSNFLVFFFCQKC